MNDEVLSAWARNRIKQLEEENQRLKVEKIRGEPEPRIGALRSQPRDGHIIVQIYRGQAIGWEDVMAPLDAPGKLSADKQFELRAHVAATLMAGMLSRQGEYVGMVADSVRMADELLAELAGQVAP
jgi:porphobilinogen deaminase